jgi:hypothetical protein
MTDAEIAEGWVRYYTGGAEADFWACEELTDLAQKDPDRAWIVIQRVNATPIQDGWSESVHAVLGCGPIEELIAVHETQMLPVILQAAISDPILRKELSTIYESSVSPAAWKRMRAILS